jgi:hypothetical protein
LLCDALRHALSQSQIIGREVLIGEATAPHACADLPDLQLQNTDYN